MPTPRLELERTALLVVDVQEKLVPVIHAADALVPQIGRLIDGANVLGLPVLVTEQYRKGLGVTVPALAQRLQGAACCHEKLKFSAFIEPVRNELAQRQVRSVLVCGIEAHVCVLQTCLDLLDGGYITAVATDGVGSRRPADRDAALQRMIQTGVIPTTVESALFELIREAGGDRFKAVLPLVK
jgi:nicotinamidase-related amidase